MTLSLEHIAALMHRCFVLNVRAEIHRRMERLICARRDAVLVNEVVVVLGCFALQI